MDLVRGIGAGWGALRVLVLALGTGAVLAGCAGSPTLLDQSDFSEDVKFTHGGNVNPPGWTWCRLAFGVWDNGTAGSELSFDDAWAAATIVDGTLHSTRPLPSAMIMREASATAATCAATANDRFAIEPLDGLAEGAIGWRTRVVGGQWGEYVMVPLDPWRLLVVGFETDQEQPPVDIDELVSLAKEGAERFPVGGG